MILQFEGERFRDFYSNHCAIVKILSHFFLSLFYFLNSCATIFKTFDTPLPDLKNYNLCFQSWLVILIFLRKLLKIPKRWANFPICHWKTLKKLVDLEVSRILLVVEFHKKVIFSNSKKYFLWNNVLNHSI